ncbi:MAG: hypothetical protein FWC47_16615 [Oscillospiraceae bacterium]|nr:hypothetical protein [Oscillospiraceae bacterium]
MREMNFYWFLINIVIAVLCGTLIPLIPKLTRKSLLFGIRIPLEQHASLEAKNLRKRYALINITGASIILVLIIIQYVIFPDVTLVSILYFPLLFAAVQMAAFISNWKQAKKLKEERGWTVSGSVFADTKSSHSRGNLSELPWIWYILSFVIIIATIIIALIKYPGLPDKISVHFGYHWQLNFGYNIQSNAWLDKTLLAVMMLPLINLVIMLIMWLAGAMLVRAKLQMDKQNPVLSFMQHCIYRKRMGHSLGALTLALTVMMTLIEFMSLYPDLNIPVWLFVVLLLVPVIAVIIVTVQSGQGGCRINLKVTPSKIISDLNGQTTVVNNDDGCGDDKYWAVGMFYHNPNDPKYLVENRFSINMGFNYSRLPVKIGVVVVLMVFVAIYVWVTVLLCSIT